MIFSGIFLCSLKNIIVYSFCESADFADVQILVENLQISAKSADFEHTLAGCSFPKNSENCILCEKYDWFFHYLFEKVCRSLF